jgi:DNA-binding NtrC family response regulator
LGTEGYGLDNIVGVCPGMRRVFFQIDQAARYDVLVLITGESGTGKDLVAQAIHRRSPRSSGPYFPVNMGAIPSELIASTLFGHERGAFTGANTQRKGIFESAAGGTLFLDEIGTMDGQMQVSLLRVLETRRFQRVGGTRFYEADVRLIAASNENLRDAVKDGSFRRDLYHRLSVFRIALPPLRKRGRDILLLAAQFLQRYNEEFGKRVLRLSPDAERLLLGYSWPGNVRELENVILRAVISAPGEELTPDLLRSQVMPEMAAPGEVVLEVGNTLEEAEKQLITQTLRQVAGNRGEAARILGISRKGIYNKIKKYNIAT